MIAYLEGLLQNKKPPLCVLNVQGVGYCVFTPMTTLYQLPACGDTVALHIHTAVREDAITLYGFINERDRLLFQTLIKVNGVGPKLALSILSGMDAEQFVACVQNQAVHQLTTIPGVGKKTAERLLLESRDRLKKWDTACRHASQPEQSQQADDAINALVALGYKAVAAEKCINSLATQHNTTESLIRAALKQGVTA